MSLIRYDGQFTRLVTLIHPLDYSSNLILASY
jgi:hypothetical protein